MLFISESNPNDTRHTFPLYIKLSTEHRKAEGLPIRWGLPKTLHRWY